VQLNATGRVEAAATHIDATTTRTEATTNRVETTLVNGFEEIKQEFRLSRQQHGSVLSLSTCDGDDKEVWHKFLRSSRREAVRPGYTSRDLKKQEDRLRQGFLEVFQQHAEAKSEAEAHQFEVDCETRREHEEAEAIDFASEVGHDSARTGGETLSDVQCDRRKKQRVEAGQNYSKDGYLSILPTEELTSSTTLSSSPSPLPSPHLIEELQKKNGVFSSTETGPSSDCRAKSPSGSIISPPDALTSSTSHSHSMQTITIQVASKLTAEKVSIPELAKPRTSPAKSALIQSALARVRRAEKRGEKTVRLSAEELEALQARKRRWENWAHIHYLVAGTVMLVATLKGRREETTPQQGDSRSEEALIQSISTKIRRYIEEGENSIMFEPEEFAAWEWIVKGKWVTPITSRTCGRGHQGLAHSPQSPRLRFNDPICSTSTTGVSKSLDLHTGTCRLSSVQAKYCDSSRPAASSKVTLVAERSRNPATIPPTLSALVTGTLPAPKKISAKTPSDFEIKAKIFIRRHNHSLRQNCIYWMTTSISEAKLAYYQTHPDVLVFHDRTLEENLCFMILHISPGVPGKHRVTAYRLYKTEINGWIRGLEEGTGS
jgi:hypothetical protein